MDDKKIVIFMKQLSKDTLAGRLSWNTLTRYNTAQLLPNHPIFNMLIQSEFRQIVFPSSYYCFIKNGIIFLLDEINELGRDGILTTSYIPYLYDEVKNTVSQLECPMGTVYQLINSIRSCLAKEESDVESFIDNYLSQS